MPARSLHEDGATIDGKPWIGEIPPEAEWKVPLAKELDLTERERGRLCENTKGICKASYAPKRAHRVYLTLPESAYRKLRAKAREVHATPNRFLAHVIDTFYEIDEQARREF